MSDVDLPGCWRSLSLGWQEKLGNRCEAGAARLLSRPLSFAASLLCFLYFFFFFFFFFFNPFLPYGKGKRTRLVTHTLPCLAGPTPDLTSFLQGISNRCCVILIGWTAGDTGFSGILSSFFFFLFNGVFLESIRIRMGFTRLYRVFVTNRFLPGRLHVEAECYRVLPLPLFWRRRAYLNMWRESEFPEMRDISAKLKADWPAVSSRHIDQQPFSDKSKVDLFFPAVKPCTAGWREAKQETQTTSVRTQ